MNAALVAGDARLLDGNDDGAGVHRRRHRTDARSSSTATSSRAAPCPPSASARSPTASCRPRAFSRMSWLDQRDDRTGTFAVQRQRLARLPAPASIRFSWRSSSDWRDQFAAVSFVGKAGDPHAYPARHRRPAFRLGRVVAALRREPAVAVQPAEPAGLRWLHPGLHRWPRSARPRAPRSHDLGYAGERRTRRSSTRSSPAATTC